MILIFVGLLGYLFLLVLGVAIWKVAGISIHVLLGIETPETYRAKCEPKIQHLPYYLDDRLPRSE